MHFPYWKEIGIPVARTVSRTKYIYKKNYYNLKYKLLEDNIKSYLGDVTTMTFYYNIERRDRC